MNVVFWFLIIVALVLIWFCASFSFKGIGRIVLRLFNDAKEEIAGEDPAKTDEDRKETSNER